MTDLTAAQALVMLHDVGGEYQIAGEVLAALIEQQAEQIAGLTIDADTAYALRNQVAAIAKEERDRANKAGSEVAALRKVIEDAPHSDQCDAMYGSWQDDDDVWHHQPCTCWKSKEPAAQITT